MAKEIERKFAVKDLSIIKGRMGASILQGYIADEPMTVRIRLIDAEAFLTLKGKTNGIERDEYEFPIPIHHAHELLNKHCGPRLIEKTRYRIPHRNQIFEVDVFHGKLAGLVIAEIELDYADQVVELPAWISIELTQDHRFSNSELSWAEKAPAIDQVPG